MTHHPQSDHHETVERWLDQHQRALDRDLDAVLDVESGLREVLLQSRHDALVDALDAVLDVESGLAAILPAMPQPPTTVRLEARGAEENQTDTEGFVQSVSPQVRVKLRVHHDVVKACRALDLARALDSALALDLALDLALQLALQLDSALDSALDSDLALVRDRVRDFVRTLDSTLDSARTRALALDSALALGRALDLARTRALVRDDDHDHDHVRAIALARGRALQLALQLALDLDLNLDRARAGARYLVNVCLNEVWRVIGVVLGRDLSPLDKNSVNTFLDDFTESDLRSADLVDIDLSGVRWSEYGTLWPPAIDVEDLKTRSEETPEGSGIYVVRAGTAPVRDLAGLA